MLGFLIPFNILFPPPILFFAYPIFLQEFIQDLILGLPHCGLFPYPVFPPFPGLFTNIFIYHQSHYIIYTLLKENKYIITYINYTSTYFIKTC